MNERSKIVAALLWLFAMIAGVASVILDSTPLGLLAVVFALNSFPRQLA